MNAEELFEKTKEKVESWRAELRVPGVTFGVLQGDSCLTAGVGVTHIENPQPVTGETFFQIGSISKTVTATLMMILVERGLLDLDARVQSYLPAFRLRDSATAQAVKVRHLATHVGGWTGDVFTDTGNNDDAAKLYVESMAEFEQLAPLGTIFSYNNAAFAVAGRVIETVTGIRYEDAVREQIFEPLGMESSSFFPHEVMLHRFAVGHQVADEAGKSETKVVRPWAIPRALNAAGGICCHVGDLLRYGAYHLGEGPPLLRADSLRQMHSPQVTINAYVGAVGLAWIISDAGGPRRLWHTGGTNGQNAILTLVPERGLALAMMANGTTGGIINDRYNKWVLREFCGIELPEPTAIDSTPDALAQYEGVYKGTMKEIALRMEEGELIAAIESERGFPTDAQLDTPPPAPIARCGEDELLVRAGQYQGSRVDVIRDESNAIRYLRFGSRLHVKQEAHK